MAWCPTAGVVLWMACSAICLFAAAVLARFRSLAPETIFLIVAGLFTGFLGADDLFLVHENVLPAFGVPEPVTYGAYALIACGYLALSWRCILNNNFMLLTAAIALLGTSVGIDWVIHSEEPWRIIVEDGAKITGICAWGAFHLTAAWRALTAAAN